MENPHEPELIKEYPCCPDCGTSNRLIAQESARAKAAGVVPMEMTLYANVKEHDIRNPNAQLRPGENFDKVRIYTDYCIDCGREYPVKIERCKALVTMKSGLTLPNQIPPQFKQN